MMPKGTIKCTYDFIHDILELPEDVRIVGFEESIFPNLVIVKIEGEKIDGSYHLSVTERRRIVELVPTKTSVPR